MPKVQRYNISNAIVQHSLRRRQEHVYIVNAHFYEFIRRTLSMAMSTIETKSVNIDDLPDEILLNIFKRLDKFDALYSLVGVNQKLNNVVCDAYFTRTVDLTTIPFDQMHDSTTNAILHRFSMEILPRTHHKMECLAIEGCFWQRVLHSSHYLSLHKLTLIQLQLNMVFDIFSEESPCIYVFKHQLSYLVVTIIDGIRNDSARTLLSAAYFRIFAMCNNLKYLDLDINDCSIGRSLLHGLPSTTWSSSTLVDLRIKMNNFQDCLCLLDGRLTQLHTLYLSLDYIYDSNLIRAGLFTEINDSAKIIENSITLLKLKCFSLHIFRTTSSFESQVVPLLGRMSQLEQLMLSVCITNRHTIIDGKYLDDNIRTHLHHLHTFHFEIVHDDVNIDAPLETSDAIRHAFKQRGYDVDCYIDYQALYGGRCHIYSFPFQMDRLHGITHNFPGGIFVNVRCLSMFDASHPFEHNFFALISRSFPSLRRLCICNVQKQKETTSNQSVKPEQRSSVIEFSHLVELMFPLVHNDYLEEFLCNSNTRLPCLSKLQVQYEQLATVTRNFTRNTTRVNCARLKHIIFKSSDDQLQVVTLVHSKDYYVYFPSL